MHLIIFFFIYTFINLKTPQLLSTKFSDLVPLLTLQLKKQNKFEGIYFNLYINSGLLNLKDEFATTSLIL